MKSFIKLYIFHPFFMQQIAELLLRKKLLCLIWTVSNLYRAYPGVLRNDNAQSKMELHSPTHHNFQKKNEKLFMKNNFFQFPKRKKLISFVIQKSFLTKALSQFLMISFLIKKKEKLFFCFFSEHDI
jgi:hypothetical protein